MKPQQILELHIDLLKRAESNDYFREFMVRDLVPPAQEKQYADVLAGAVRSAYCYRASADFSTLMQFAATQLDESDAWDASLAPTAAGLVRFDDPLPIFDVYGHEQKAHWMLWGPSLEGGTFLYFWNDHNDPDDTAKQVLKSWDPRSLQDVGRWGSIGGPFRVVDGSSLGPVELQDPTTYDQRLMTHGRVTKAAPIGFGSDVTFRPPTNMARFLHAFWLLLAQTVVETEGEHVRSTTARNAQRRGLASTLTVVRLRRSSGNRGAGESTVEWTRRWVVRGHWRWQRHGVGRQEKRRIWIDPHIKGPEEAPLIVTDKLYDL